MTRSSGRDASETGSSSLGGAGEAGAGSSWPVGSICMGVSSCAGPGLVEMVVESGGGAATEGEVGVAEPVDSAEAGSGAAAGAECAAELMVLSQVRGRELASVERPTSPSSTFADDASASRLSRLALWTRSCRRSSCECFRSRLPQQKNTRDGDEDELQAGSTLARVEEDRRSFHGSMLLSDVSPRARIARASARQRGFQGAEPGEDESSSLPLLLLLEPSRPPCPSAARRAVQSGPRPAQQSPRAAHSFLPSSSGMERAAPPRRLPRRARFQPCASRAPARRWTGWMDLRSLGLARCGAGALGQRARSHGPTTTGGAAQRGEAGGRPPPRSAGSWSLRARRVHLARLHLLVHLYRLPLAVAASPRGPSSLLLLRPAALVAGPTSSARR